MTSCTTSIWPLISLISGVVAFLTSIVSLVPQLIETHKTKSVEGLSFSLLACWLAGDITTLIGAVLTNQLLFQIIISIYYLLNDVFIWGQYYYYGILHGNSLATVGHGSKPHIESLEQRTTASYQASEQSESPVVRRRHRHRHAIFSYILAIFLTFSRAEALPMLITVFATESPTPTTPPIPVRPSGPIGLISSWLGAFFYLGGRIPQLIKNYKRKSTDGVSTFLFIFILVSNIAYALSIFTSCEFLDSPDRLQYLNNALPFLIGTAGTIFFDLIYFYQHYILYYDDFLLRQQVQALENSEAAPLLH